MGPLHFKFLSSRPPSQGTPSSNGNAHGTYSEKAQFALLGNGDVMFIFVEVVFFIPRYDFVTLYKPTALPSPSRATRAIELQFTVSQRAVSLLCCVKSMTGPGNRESVSGNNAVASERISQSFTCTLCS